MESTVESLCNVLARNHVLEAEAVRTLRVRWRNEAGAASDNVGEFGKWLVRNGALTDFQLDMAQRGFADSVYFGDYKLLDRIGQGRMAGVYKAAHPLGQTVAIKVLPPSKAKQPQVLGRFLREARLAVKLDHDNIVRTFQNGQVKDMHYIVMEYLEGETLEEVLKRRKRLPVSEAIQVLIQALKGLDHLHEVGLVHRDLKPGNLMLVPDGTSGPLDGTLKSTVKILDIGLGRALFDESVPAGEVADLTRDGAIVGTLSYMAPEQARSAHTADIRADIYSLGCVAYEMLSGQPPFTDTNFAQQMQRHAEERPRPLSEMVPGVPAALDNIVQTMLAKDPAMRYATPGQAIKELNALASAAPVAKPVRPMRSYLTWLETQRKEEVQEPQLPDMSLPSEPDPAPVPATAPSSPLNGAAAAPVVVPAGPPLAVPVAPAVQPAPPPDVLVAPPAAEPSSIPSARTNPFLAFCKATAKAVGARIRAYGWGKRDWISACVGAGALFLLQCIYWLIRWLFG